MAHSRTLAIVSDIHFASAAEKERGWIEATIISNPLLRLAVRMYRYFVWRRDPFAHNYLLDEFLTQARGADYVFGNGDYSCDTAFIGLSDPAAFLSASECVDRLRKQFVEGLHLTIGDHELGKISLFGGRGGMRIASWQTTLQDLRLEPFWTVEIGRYVIIGVTSSLLALPVYEPETLAAEREAWRELRAQHLKVVRELFEHLRPNQRVLLFCHDPTALPFLWRDELVRSKLPQIERTIIGHLHSEFYLWKSRRLAGMPKVAFLGNSVRRMSAALHDARHWNAFKILLCPSLAGIELLKDGGYYEVELDLDARQPLQFRYHRLRWRQ